MDDDSCLLKYIEIVHLDNNTEQTDDLKPFEIKVYIVNYIEKTAYSLSNVV